MNKIFRVIWNRTLNMWIVASELATGRTKASSVGKITLKREKELNNISTLKSLTQALFSSGMVSLLTMANVIGFVSWSNQANANYIDIGQNNTGGRFSSSNSPNGSISIGDSAKVGAGGENSIAIGTGSKIRGTGSGDMGGATVAHKNSIAIGYNAKAWGVQADDSVALGSGATAGGISTIAIGKDSDVSSVNGLAIGTSAKAGNHAIALGASAKATATKGISIGESSQVTSNNSIAIGDKSKATTAYSTALGSESSAEGNVSTALGNGAKTKGSRSIALGTHAYVEAANNTDSVENSIAIGSDSRVKKENSIAIGQAAEVLGGYSVAVGQNSKALDTGTSAFGEMSKAQGNRATALGNNSSALQQNAVAVGYQANANADSAIAIGKGANVAHAHSVALGSGATAVAGTARTNAVFDSWTLTWNGGTSITNNATVNVGGRQIQSIAAGDVSQDSTDAINGSQLWALANTKMTFAGDTGTSAQRRIGDTMNIKGATGSIFTFEGNGSDTLTLELNKANTGNLVQGSNVSVTGDLNNRLIGAGNVTIDLNQTSKDLLNKVSSAGNLSVTGNDLTMSGTGTSRLLGLGNISIGLSNDAQAAINNAKNKGNLTVDTTYLTISNGDGRLLGNTEAKIELSSSFKQKLDKIKTYNVIPDNSQNNNPITITSNTTGDSTTFKVKVDEAKLKAISSGSVHIAGSDNVTINEGTVDTTGKKTYTINVSNLSYKANGTNQQNVKLSDGLNFINGDHTVATVAANGNVKFDLNDAAKTALTRASTGGITFKDSGSGAKKVTLDNEVKFIGSDDISATVSASGSNAHITLAINKEKTITDSGSNKGLVSGATVKTYVDKVKDEINASVSSQANLKFDGNSKTGTPKVNLGNDTLSIKGEANSFVTTEANDKTLTIKIDDAKFKSAVGNAAATSAMLKYKGGTDTTGKEVALGTGLNFQGDDNISVTIGDKGLVTHKLAQALKGITSIAHSDNGAKLTLDADKLSVNNKKIDGLANADLTADSTQAVTGQQLKQVKDIADGNKTNITNLTTLLGDGKLKFEGNTGGEQTVALNNGKLSITGDGTLVKTASSATGLAISIDDAKLKEKVQEAVDVVGTGVANVTSAVKEGKKTFTVNVAEDQIKALSQGAVNVVSANDLITVSDNTANGVKTFTLTANADKLAQGVNLTYKANNTGDKTVTLSQGLNFTNGTNTTAAIDNNGVVKFNVNPELTDITSIAGSGTTVTWGADGLTLNNKKITKLEDATLDANSTDAVTGRQLHAVKEKVGEGKLKFTGNTTTPDSGSNVPSVALNGGALNIVGDTTAGKNFITTAAQGQNLTISIDTDKFKTAVATVAATGTELKYKAANESSSKGVLLGAGLHFKSANANMTVETKENGEIIHKLADALTGITSVTGLNAGEIGENSTAAINGKQLHTLADALGLKPNNNLFEKQNFEGINTKNGTGSNVLSSDTVKAAVEHLITATNKGLIFGASQGANGTEGTHYLGSSLKITPLSADFTNNGDTFKGSNLVTTYESVDGNAKIGIGLKEDVVLKSVKGLEDRKIPTDETALNDPNSYGKGTNKNRAATEGAVRTLADTELKFIGNNSSATAVGRKLGQTLSIKGEGTIAAGTNTAANNIKVDVSGTDGLEIKLASKLVGIDSFSKNPDGTGAKITLGDNNTIDFGGAKITNISNVDADLVYRANSAADNHADTKKVKINKGLDFVDTHNITASVEDNGIVKHTLKSVLTKVDSISGTPASDTDKATTKLTFGKDTLTVSALGADGASAVDPKLTGLAKGTIGQNEKDAVTTGQIFDLKEKLGLTLNAENTGFANLTFDAIKTATGVGKDDSVTPTTIKGGIESLISAVNKGMKFGADNNKTTPNLQFLGSSLNVISTENTINEGNKSFVGGNLFTKYEVMNGNGTISIGLSEKPEFKAIELTKTNNDNDPTKTVVDSAGVRIVDTTTDKPVTSVAKDKIEIVTGSDNGSEKKLVIGKDGSNNTGSIIGLTERSAATSGDDYGKTAENKTRAATEAAVRELYDAGLKFRGNAGANNSDPEVARKIGEMLRIEGEGTVAGDTAADNIRVNADSATNKLVIKLANALTNLHSIKSVSGTNPFELSKDRGLTVASRSNNKVYESHTLGSSFEIKSADDVNNPNYSTVIKLDGATKTATIGEISVNGGADKSITGLAHRVAQNGTAATTGYGEGDNAGRAATEGAVRALTLNLVGDESSTGSVKLSEQTLSVKGEKGITVVAQNQGYTVSVDNAELVKNVKLSYKAEDEADKRETTLGDGLVFKHGDNTTAVTEDSGVVKINLNSSLKNITDISGKPATGEESTKIAFGKDTITLSTINNAGNGAGTKDPKLTGLGLGNLATDSKDALTAAQLFDLNQKLGLTINNGTGFAAIDLAAIQTGAGNNNTKPSSILNATDKLISAVNEGIKFGADTVAGSSNPNKQYLGSTLNVKAGDLTTSTIHKGKNLKTEYAYGNGVGTISIGLSEKPEFKVIELTKTNNDNDPTKTVVDSAGVRIVDTTTNNPVTSVAKDKIEIVTGSDNGTEKKLVIGKDGSNNTGSIIGLTERSAATSGDDYGKTAENKTRAATEGAVRELADQVSLQDDSSPFEYANANGKKLLKGKDGKFYTPEQLKNAVWDPNTNTYTGLTGTDVAAAGVVIKAKGVGHQVTNLLSGMGLTAYPTNVATDFETARNNITNLTGLTSTKLNNAATVGDLKTLAIAGLNFKGNMGNSIHRNLGEELTIKGGLADNKAASAENLRVDAENNALIIKLAKAIKNIDSIESAEPNNGESGFKLTKAEGLTLTSKDANGAKTVSVSNSNGTTVKNAEGSVTTIKPAEVSVKDPQGNTASVKPTEIKVADANSDNVTTIGNDKISMQNGKDGANGKDGMDLTASNIVFKSKDPADKTSSTLDKEGLVFTDDKGNEVIKLDATTGVINKLSSGAKTYDEPELEGEKLKQANDGQWYLAKDVDSKGVPASGKTPVIAMADDGKYYKVNAAGKADTSTPEIAIGKAGLIDFAKSDETAAATVADLKNLGFEVNVKDKTGTSTYKDQVRHGNTLSVSGSKDGLVHVTGKTTNGERELIIDVKRAEHIVEKGTGLDKDGNRLVKVGDNYYKPEDVNSDGTVIAGRQPVADDKIAVRDTDGNGFVTGNQVGAALSKSGFVVGKGEASDMESRQENRDEHINPNDELRFADGKNTTVTLTTQEDVDATGNHKTVTNVRIDVDLPIADKYTINKDGKEVEVVKGKDGKFYAPNDVDEFGKPKANAQAIDIAATPVKRDIKLEGSDYTIGTNGTEKDAIVKGSGGVNINNVAWAENPDQAINKDQLDKTVNAGGFFVKNNGNSVSNPADNVAEKVTNKDIVDFVDGANTRISVDTTRDPATGVDTSKISVHVTDLPTKHTVYIDGKETIVTKVGGKYYAVGENARPDTSKEIPANIIAGAKVNVANVAAKPNEIGAKTRLGNVASATESIAADPSFKTVDFNGDIYDARDVVVTYKLKDPKAALVKVGEGEEAKYYRPEDLTFEYGKVTVKAGKEGDNVKNVVVVDGHAYDKENAKPTGTRLLDNAEALVKVGEGDNAQFYRQSDVNSGTPRAGAVAVNSKAHRDHKAFAGIADLNGANRADVITVDDAKRMGFVVGTRNVDPNNASAYADKIQNANKLEIVGDNNIEVVGVTKGNTREVTVNVVKNPKFDSVELGHRDPATGKHTKGPKLSGDRNGDLVLTKQARDQDGNILRDQNNQPILTNVRISGVAAGRIAEDSTDAVNGSQIYNLARSFGQQLHDTKQRLSSGIAGAYAMSSLIQSSLPGEKVVSIAGGTYEGQTSVALGFSATTDNGKFTIKAAGTRSGTGELGGSIGAGYRW